MKKKICIYCDKWGSGGIESFLLNVLEHIDLSGLNVHIVVAKVESPFYLERVRALELPVHVLSGSARKLRTNHRMFRELIEREKFDAVYLNLFQALSLSYGKQAKKLGVPLCVVHSHNRGLRKSVGKPLKLLIHFFARRYYASYADVQLACSEQAARFMFLDETSWTWVPNGIDVSRFVRDSSCARELRERMNLTGKLVLGNVGRLCDQKNQMFLLEVVSQLRREGTDAVLLLIGEGEDRQKLEAEIASRHMQPYVRLLGNCGNVAELYQVMDWFLFPSRFEGLGIAAVEAQAAGLPVLCAAGLPEEVKCCESLQFLPIDRGVAPWINAIHTPIPNTACAQAVIDRGYQIEDVCQRYEKLWAECRCNPKRIGHEREVIN